MFASASPFSKSHFAEEPDEVGIAVVYNLVFDDTADVSQSGTSGDDTFNLSMPLTTSSGAGFTHSISISGQTGTDTTVITSSGGSGTYFDLTTASIATEQLDAGLNDLILASTSLSNVTIASVDEILFTNAGYYAFDLGSGSTSGTVTAPTDGGGIGHSLYIYTNYQVAHSVDQDWTFNFGDNPDSFQSGHFASGWVVYMGDGNDFLSPGYDGEHELYGEGGDDYIWHSGLNTISDGGTGSDTIQINFGAFDGATVVASPVIIDLAPLWSGGTATIGTGSAQNYDLLANLNFGSEYRDVITLGQFDTPYAILGANHNWELLNGNDTFYGTADREIVIAGRGDDVVFGYDGNDDLQGREGSDELYGGDGDDAITDDNLQGATSDAGADVLDGGAGDDHLIAWLGADTVTGGTGDDKIGVYDLNDTVDGGADTDTLYVILGELSSGVNLDFTDLLSGGTLAIGSGSISGIERLSDGIAVTGSSSTDHDDTIFIPSFYSLSVYFNLAHGDDYIESGSGDDLLTGYFGNDVMHGNDGDDEIYGDYGDDTLYGGNGDDMLLAGNGTDQLFGDAGNDHFSTLYDANTIDGGADTDTVQLDNLSGTVLNLRNQANNAGGALDDTFTNVEVFIGTSFDDLMLGGAEETRFEGGAGNDTLSAGGGNDTLIGGSGTNTLNGQAGDDTFIGGNGIDAFNGGAGFDTVIYDFYTHGFIVDMLNTANSNYDATGDSFVSIEQIISTDFDDTLRGSNDGETFRAGDGGDVLLGRDGDDTLFGDGGDDLMIGGDGGDTLRGGAGFDIVSYQTASTGVTVDLTNLAANTGEAAGDSYAAIEQYRGGDFDDTFVLDGSNADVRGMDGNDTLTGGIGRNSLYGDAGDDVLNGGGDRDRLVGGTGDDTLDGGTGIDRLYGDAGEDILRGGLDNDFLRGGADGDILNGGGGFDRLYGDAGDDLLIGSLDRDILFGGTGSDVFRYTQAADSGIGGTRDTIMDFEVTIDDIDLTALGVTDFISSAAFTGAGNEVRATSSGPNNTLLEIDLDGDTVADMTILLRDVTDTMTSGDFLLA